MNLRDYLNQLDSRFEKYFDVNHNSIVLNEKIDLFAQFKVINTRNFITKKDVVDSYENNEYCFVKSYEILGKEDLDGFIGFLKLANDEFVRPGHNHMSTYITGVIVSGSSIDNRLDRYIKDFKYVKPYKFYLNGWSEIRLVLVDLINEKLTVNKSAGRVKKVYQLTP